MNKIGQGTWEQERLGIRRNFQRIASTVLGSQSMPTFAGVYLTGLTANALIFPDTNKLLTSATYLTTSGTTLDIAGKITVGSQASPQDVTTTRQYGIEIHYSGNNYSVTGIRSRAQLVTTDTSATAQGALLQAANNDGINAGVLQGALIEAVGKSTGNAATITTMRGALIGTEWGALDTVTNLKTLHIRGHSLNAAGAGSFGTGYALYIENEAVGGNGQAYDAGIYFKGTNLSAGNKAFTYGIDFSGGSYGTAEMLIGNAKVKSSSNDLILQPITNSTTFFQVLDAAGNQFLTLDSTNRLIGVRATPWRYPLYVPWISGDSYATARIGSSDASNNKNAIEAYSYSKAGIYAETYSNYGVWGSASSGTAILGTSLTGLAGSFTINHPTDNNLQKIFEIKRDTSAVGHGVNGIGGYWTISVQNDAGIAVLAGRVGALLTDVTSGSENSAYFWSTVGGGVDSEKMRLNHLGYLGLNEVAPETILELTHATPYITGHVSTHSDALESGLFEITGKREDGAGTETESGHIKMWHDGAGVNDQLTKMTFGVNTGSGVVDAMVLDSNLAASFTKIKLTEIGGYAIKLTNKTGANTVVGQTVKADITTDDAVILTAADDVECIGVFLDSGIVDAAEAWVVVAGIADVAMEDNTAATHGNWVQTSETEAGYADSTDTSPQAAPQHFNEIGHCIESVTAGGGGTHILARCILHFN